MTPLLERLKAPLPLAGWLILLLLAVYWSSYPAGLGSIREVATLSGAYSLLNHGQATVGPVAWATSTEITWVQGQPFARQRPGLALLTAPLLWLGSLLPGLSNLSLALLLGSMATALTGGWLFLWLMGRGYSRRVALLTALSYSLCTFAWPDARSLLPWPLLALLTLTALHAADHARHHSDSARTKALILSGSALGGGLLFGLEILVALIGIGLYIFALPWPKTAPSDSRPLWQRYLAFLLPAVGFVGLGSLLDGLAFGGLGELAYRFELVGVLASLLPIAMLLLARGLTWAEQQNSGQIWGAVAIPAITAALFNLVTVLTSPTAPVLWFAWRDPYPALQLLLPPLVLLIVAGFNLGLNLTRPRAYTPAWLALSLTLFLGIQLVAGASHLQQQQPAHPADPGLMASLTQADAPAALLISPAPATELTTLTQWLIAQEAPAHTLIWPHAARLAQPRPPVAPPLETWLFSLPAERLLWLYEQTDSVSAPHSPLRRQVDTLAFGYDVADSGGQISRYALPQTPAHQLDFVPLEVPFGPLTVRHFAIADPISPAKTLNLWLTWKVSNSPPAGAVIAFVQLLSPTGELVAQEDRLLIDQTHLHQSPLQPGETRSLGYALPLPPTIPPGEYPLIIGLYHAETLTRLPRTDGSPDDFLYLTTLVY